MEGSPCGTDVSPVLEATGDFPAENVTLMHIMEDRLEFEVYQGIACSGQWAT